MSVTMFKRVSLFFSFLILSSGVLMAAGTSNVKSKPVAADEMRCEKLLATSLSDFKAALVENCDLNKPFSSSLSRVLNDEVYFYCCHKR